MSKIINDPVHGFINIKYDIALKCIDHKYFQRLRNISQLGLTSYVYPGATHSRFHHALGAFHLMQVALNQLKDKGVKITIEEEEGACIAILLHDIGHGPFSHTLEHSILKGISHEMLSLKLMSELNIEFDNKLSLAISMFTNQYYRPFFHQLISSQLDVDRLDYLKRDSFYTGVIEGNISVDRILAMLDVVEDELVVLEKGAMSIEDYLLSRKIMYWQVYLHKTVLSVENMLIKVFKRMDELFESNNWRQISNPTIQFFLNKKKISKTIELDSEVVDQFIKLDDSDIIQLLKELTTSDDIVLRVLSSCILNRKLYKVISSIEPFELRINSDFPDILKGAIEYFNFQELINLTTYSMKNSIKIVKKNGVLIPFEEYSKDSGFGNFIENKGKYFSFNLPVKNIVPFL